MDKVTYVAPETLDMAHAMAANRSGDALLLEGNAKLGSFGKFGFMYRTKGLAIHDCLTRTSVCEAACYAVKDHLWNLHLDRGVSHVYSLLAHTDPCELYDRLDADIKTICTPARIRAGIVIRIHESGDFVSRMHVRIYAWLAAKYPMIQFFGYSRAFADTGMRDALAELNSLPNVYIRESTDNERYVGCGDTAMAFFGDKDKQPVRAFTCVEQLTFGTNNYIQCVDCGLCWTQPKLNVIFIEHGPGKGKKKKKKK